MNICKFALSDCPHTSIMRFTGRNLHSSPLVGAPKEHLSQDDLNIATLMQSIYKKNMEALGNNPQLALKNNIKRNPFLFLHEAIENTAGGLSYIEDTIQNMAVKNSDIKTKKILEIEIHCIKQHLDYIKDILNVMHNSQAEERE